MRVRMGQKDTAMPTDPTPVEHLDGVYTLTRRRLAEPRLVDAADADALFQERVIELHGQIGHNGDPPLDDLI